MIFPLLEKRKQQLHNVSDGIVNTSLTTKSNLQYATLALRKPYFMRTHDLKQYAFMLNPRMCAYAFIQILETEIRQIVSQWL